MVFSKSGMFLVLLKIRVDLSGHLVSTLWERLSPQLDKTDWPPGLVSLGKSPYTNDQKAFTAYGTSRWANLLKVFRLYCLPYISSGSAAKNSARNLPKKKPTLTLGRLVSLLEVLSFQLEFLDQFKLMEDIFLVLFCPYQTKPFLSVTGVGSNIRTD